MVKSNKKILGISLIVLILGMSYMFKDAIKVIIIQKQAINNYNNTRIFFDSLSTFSHNEIYYSIQLLENDFISIDISNIDKNLRDSIRSSNDFDLIGRIENLKLINLNQVECNNLPELENKFLVQNERIFKDWKIRYSGLISDQLLKNQFQKLDISYEDFRKQLTLMSLMNCSKMEIHNEGIFLSFKKEILLKSGCIKRFETPGRYNIGTTFLLRNNLIKYKELEGNVQCLISV